MSDRSLKTVNCGTALGSTLVGLEPGVVTVRAEVTPRAAGVARFEICGLSDEATREARVRVRSALAASGIAFDNHHVTVTIQDLPAGSDAAPLDLAIATAVLRALGRLDANKPISDLIFVGELSLSGEVRSVRGLFPRLGADAGTHGFVVPAAGTPEVGLAPTKQRERVFCVGSLNELVALPRHWTEVPSVTAIKPHVPHGREDLRGAHRDILYACKDEPRVLLVGPPGSGKTMIARRIASELPGLEGDALAEVLAVCSAAGLLDARTATTAPPFRAPHHTVSTAGLLGGGARFRPGEVTLAHRGVLVLDEVTEFRRGVLEDLARALEAGTTCAGILPAAPARVVAAANPCPCGWYGSACRCYPDLRRLHEERLDGLVRLLGLKRFDVPLVDLATLAEGSS